MNEIQLAAKSDSERTECGESLIRGVQNGGLVATNLSANCACYCLYPLDVRVVRHFRGRRGRCLADTDLTIVERLGATRNADS